MIHIRYLSPRLRKSRDPANFLNDRCCRHKTNPSLRACQLTCWWSRNYTRSDAPADERNPDTVHTPTILWAEEASETLDDEVLQISRNNEILQKRRLKTISKGLEVNIKRMCTGCYHNSPFTVIESSVVVDN